MTDSARSSAEDFLEGSPLGLEVLSRVRRVLADAHPDLVAEFEAKREEARAYAYEHGEDLPEVVEWEFGR